jgi:hypothetical protein
MNVETPTQIYVDLTVSNNDVGINQSPTPLQFYTRRDADYIFNPNDYYASVCRWSIDCRFPMIVPQIPLGTPGGPPQYQVDAGGHYYWPTVYYVNFTTPGGTTYQQNIPFYPEISNPAQIPPISVVTNVKQLYDDPYFYISSVSWWLFLVNRAIATGYAAFASLNPGTSATAPAIEYNYDGTFNMLAPSTFLNAQVGGTPQAYATQIWFNSPLYTLFQFPAQYSYSATQPPFSYLNYQILFNAPLQTVTILGNTFYYTKTETPSLQFWSPLSSVVFCSQSIPVEPTNQIPTIVLGSSTNTDKNGVNNNINVANIISDFEVNLVKGYEGRSINYYSPPGEYRLLDVIGNRPLSELNVIVYWRDKLIGALHPVVLHSGGAASLKILFRKKNFFSQGL